ncbi:MAG: hypothetical protein J5730_03145 [Bacteroidales bacterium]|nr:hypothetical protein [Bacteroidales bacterium]
MGKIEEYKEDLAQLKRIVADLDKIGQDVLPELREQIRKMELRLAQWEKEK